MEIKYYPDSNNKIRAIDGTTEGRVRQANEDSSGFTKTVNGDLFVVCDGMGGHVGGSVASKTAVDGIIYHLSKERYPDVSHALRGALVYANDQILGTAREDVSLKGMGTTACIILVRDDEVFIAHIGDSRIYLFVDKDKALYRITEDHSLVQSMVRNREIDDLTAEHHAQKNIILRGLGIKEEIKPEVAANAIRPARGDLFLICSDGLSDMIDDNEIEAILANGGMSLEQKLRSLIAKANAEDKGKDNITVQLIEITQSDNRKTEGYVSKNPSWRQPDKKTSRNNAGRVSFKPLIKLASLIALVALLLLGGWWLWKKTDFGDKNIEKKEQTLKVEQGRSDSLKEVMDKARAEHGRLLELSNNGKVPGIDISSTAEKLDKAEKAFNAQNAIVAALKKEIDSLKQPTKNENTDNRPSRKQ